MSVSARARRRAAAALVLVTIAVVGWVAPASAAGSTVSVPKARPGAAILVTYRDAAATAKGGSASPTAKATGTVKQLNVRIFKASRGQEQKAMRELAAERGVVAIESDVVIKSTLTPDDPLWPTYIQWAHNKVSLPAAWDTTRGTTGRIIAIVDSGLEITHPEFADRLVPGYDFIDYDTSTNDPRGHGTMSAGAASARGNNAQGVAGSCWECRIMPVRVLNQYGSGYASTAIKGIVWAADHGAHIISMSFGGFSPTTAMADAITYARTKGAVVLASAGNEGNTTPFYPGAYPGVIAVAASDPYDRIYSWSNRGSWVELTAPGCFWTTQTGNSYGNFCGTSASTPLVSGIVGLIWAANPAATRADVERALLSTATPMGYVANGRPNAAAAIQAIQTLAAPPAPPAPAPAPTPTPTPTPTTHAWVESGGQVTIEAERANTRISRSGKSWITATGKTGYVGRGYVAAWTDTGWYRDTNYATTSAELRYRVKFSTAGTYALWLRTWVPNGGGDSVHAGLNGQAIGSANRISQRTYARWAWTRSTMDGHTAYIRIPAPGLYTVNVWVREDGFRLDRLVLTRGTAPTGSGPRESGTIQVPA